MLITLLRFGGIIPITKKAEKEVDWTDEEMTALLSVIKDDDAGHENKRDVTGYELKYNAGTFSINMEKVPAKYKKIFDDLVDDLVIVKPTT